MESRILEDKQKETSPGGRLLGEARKTVQRLIKQAVNISQAAAPREPERDAQDVLLDEEIDGVRYLLVRSHPKPSQVQTFLSPREQEIARMVAKGHPNKVIAAVLDISPWTVSTHLRRIFAKLSVGSRAAMVARLLEEGLLREQSESAQLAMLRHKRP